MTFKADGTSPPPERKALRCRLGWHRWVNHRNPDGVGYRLCSRCGKDQNPGTWQWQQR